MMRAIVCEEYGPPEILQLKEVETPKPKEGEVRIRIQATTVTKYDCWMRSGTAPPGFGLLMRIASSRKPKQPILGTELAGEIDAVGAGVTGFKTGEAVYGYPGMNLGAYAEYICLPEGSVANMPANLSFNAAAGVLQGALTALYFLSKANIQQGQKILIFGASGGVGSYAVHLAKYHFGADVTGVCSTKKLDFVKSLGAERVIDYSKEDFSQSGTVYDIIFDTVGKTSIANTRKSLKENGTYLLATFGLPMLVQLLWLSRTSKQNFVYGALKEKNKDMVLLRELLEAGVIKPVIDRSYPFEQIAEAHRYVESGAKKGIVSIVVKNN
jgi:NADPH:quinone reductase-like Zn-dependent oxidoreductase